MLCSLCSTSADCNSDTVRRDENCIICSSAFNVNCAQKPIALHAERCSLPSDGQCFSRVAHGATIRGCKGILTSADEKECSSNITCSMSTGQGSNNKIIPNNRLKCHHCDSRINSICADKTLDTSLTMPCIKYSPPESCLKLELNGAGKRKINKFNVQSYQISFHI